MADVGIAVCVGVGGALVVFGSGGAFGVMEVGQSDSLQRAAVFHHCVSSLMSYLQLTSP